MKHAKLLKILVLLAVSTVVATTFIAMPIDFASAQTLSVKCAAGAPNCDFNDLLNLARNIINFIILVSIPAAAIAFAYAGYLMLTAQGNSSQISDARAIFWKVLIGFLFILSGWLIVRTITDVLLKEDSYWNPFVMTSGAELAANFEKLVAADNIIL